MGVPEVALEVGVGNGVVADRALATGVLEFLRRNKLRFLFSHTFCQPDFLLTFPTSESSLVLLVGFGFLMPA